MSNFYQVMKKINEDENKINDVMNQYIAKAIEKYKLFDNNAESLLRVLFLLDPTPNKNNLSRMTKISVNQNQSEFIRNVVYIKQYFKFIGTNLSEYSIKIKKINQFNKIEELKEWLVDSIELLKQRKEKRGDKRPGSTLIFSDDLFDAYLITDPKFANEVYGGFATWCWTKQPKYWRQYTRNGLLFVLENKEIDNFVKNSPPDVETQEKYIACSLNVYKNGNCEFGEINHLNNRTSEYAKKIKDMIETFVESVETKMNIDIKDFENVYDRDNEIKTTDYNHTRTFDNLFRDYEMIDRTLIINDTELVIEVNDMIDDVDAIPDLTDYEILFFGERMSISGLPIDIVEAPNLKRIMIEGFESYLIIEKSNNIKEAYVGDGGFLTLGDIKKIDDLIIEGGICLFDVETKIDNLEVRGGGADIEEFKVDGKGKIIIDISNAFQISSGEGVMVEVEWAGGKLSISESFKGSGIFLPYEYDRYTILQIGDSPFSDNFKEITTSLRLAHFNRIECDNLESFVKKGKIILLNDLDGNFEPYEYKKKHWKNGKFIFGEEMGIGLDNDDEADYDYPF